MIVVKIGGNAVWPREAGGIDDVFVDVVFRYLLERFERSRDKMILLPGGIGGQVFIEWARRAGCSNATLNDVGCQLIDLSARILVQLAINSMGSVLRVCPTPACSLSALDRLVRDYDCVVAGVPVKGALTSDSVAALVAEHTGSSLVFIKNSRPFANMDCYLPGNADSIDLDKAISSASSTFPGSRPGFGSASLDLLCLTILERSRLPAHVITRDALLKRNIGAEPAVVRIQAHG